MSGGLARRRRREARKREREAAIRRVEEHPEEFVWLDGRLKERAKLSPEQLARAVDHVTVMRDGGYGA